MTDLQKLQKGFSEAIISKDIKKVSDSIVPHASVSKQAQLNIYSNNYYAGLLKVLEQIYPCTKKLVGENFFAGMCAEFCKMLPPDSGNLDDYGGELPSFIKEFKPAASLPYLSKFSGFEWLYHVCQNAADAPHLIPADMEKFSVDDYTELKLTLHPSVKFLSAKFPILKIWQMCQEENPKELNLDKESGCRLVLVRKDSRVDVITAENDEFRFLSEIAKGKSLRKAFDKTSEDFDLAFYLNKHILAGTFCDSKLGNN